MRRSGTVLFQYRVAGTVWQDENGYGFEYNKDYLNLNDALQKIRRQNRKSL